MIKGSNGIYQVMLANLSDQELAALKVTRSVRTIPGHRMASFFFPNWPDQVDFAQARKPDENPANQAIKEMGVAALPYLTKDLHSRESRLMNLACRWVWPLIPGKLQGWIGRPIHPSHKRMNAAYALGLLGDAARPAIAELERVVQDDDDLIVRAVARESLAELTRRWQVHLP